MMHELTESLLYSGLKAAGNEEQYHLHDIEHVIQLTYSEPDGGYPPEVTVHTFSMMDGPRNDETVFRNAVAETVALLREDATVLVHCSAGESRSPCIAAAALGQLEGTSFDDALTRVRNAGPVNAHAALRDRGRACCPE